MDQRRLALVVWRGRNNLTRNGIWLAPAALRKEMLLQSPLSMVALIITMIAGNQRDIDIFNRKAPEWSNLAAALERQLRALYVEASAENGEFTRPRDELLDAFFRHAEDVVDGARAYSLELPPTFVKARRVLGFAALGLGVVEMLGDHAADTVAEGMALIHDGHLPDSVNFFGDFSHADLFDLDAMIRHVDVHMHLDASALDDPPPPDAYGLPSLVDGDPRVNPVDGYFRADGTFVHAYWRGARG